MVKQFSIINYQLSIKTQSAFTLIELLVTISIIALISALLLANFNAARERARDAQRKGDLRNIQTALVMYYNDYGNYPDNGSGANLTNIVGCGTQPNPSVCAWGGAWSIDGKVLMSTLPKDPLPGQSYAYDRIDLDSYTLQACLENKSDDKGIANASCPSGKMIQLKP